MAITYYFKSFQHKARSLSLALKANGLRPTHSRPDIAFYDRPAGMPLMRAVIMEYPHSALPPWWYDGLETLPDEVRCVFVIGEAQKEAMKIIAPRANVKVCGFPWADRVPFQNGKVERILFAPIHPSKKGIRPEARETNQRIQLALSRLKGYQIFCRTVGDRKMQGIDEKIKMTYISGLPDGSTRDIDMCDLVIAEGTFLFLAVARGKPVIGINQNVPNRMNYDTRYPENWDKYGHLFKYPVDFDDAPLPELLHQNEQTEWKERCMPEFDGKLFADSVVEAYGR